MIKIGVGSSLCSCHLFPLESHSHIVTCTLQYFWRLSFPPNHNLLRVLCKAVFYFFSFALAKTNRKELRDPNQLHISCASCGHSNLRPFNTWSEQIHLPCDTCVSLCRLVSQLLSPENISKNIYCQQQYAFIGSQRQFCNKNYVGPYCFSEFFLM